MTYLKINMFRGSIVGLVPVNIFICHLEENTEWFWQIAQAAQGPAC